jgi:hypothetical protein
MIVKISEYTRISSEIWAWTDLPEVYPTLGSAGCTELTSPVYGNARKSFGEDNLEEYLILKTGKVREVMNGGS